MKNDFKNSVILSSRKWQYSTLFPGNTYASVELASLLGKIELLKTIKIIMINKLFATQIGSVCFRSFRQTKKVCIWTMNAISKETKHLPFFISRLKAWYELHVVYPSTTSWTPHPYLPPPSAHFLGKFYYFFDKRRLNFAGKLTTEMDRRKRLHLVTPPALHQLCTLSLSNSFLGACILYRL